MKIDIGIKKELRYIRLILEKMLQFKSERLFENYKKEKDMKVITEDEN